MSRFAERLEAACRAMGATTGPSYTEGYRQLQIETIYGLLYLMPNDEALRTRFEVVPKTDPGGTSLNRFSGKWNFEFGLRPREEELVHAIGCLLQILPDGPDARMTDPDRLALMRALGVRWATFSRTGPRFPDSMCWQGKILAERLHDQMDESFRPGRQKLAA